MAGGLADTVATAFGAGGETLERGALFDEDGLDLRDRGYPAPSLCSALAMAELQHFFNDTSSFFLRERQDVQSLIHLLATDQIGYQAALVYPTSARHGEQHVFQTCSFLYFLAFLSAG